MTTYYVKGEVCDDDNGTIEARTGGLIDSFIHKLDDGMMIYHASSGGQSFHYHTDDLGNVLALTDAAGNVVERYDYDDFGLPALLAADGTPTLETSSAVGNPFLFHGMEWDAETGFYFGHSQGSTTGPIDPKTGRAVRGKVKDVRNNGDGFADGNPWSGGGSPNAMKKGTVKFFNETKGFGRVTGAACSLIVPVAMDKGLRFRGSAAMASRNILKTYFETGDTPTQDQFRKLLDRGQAGDVLGRTSRKMLSMLDY